MSVLLALQGAVQDVPIRSALLDPIFLLFVLGLAGTIGILFRLALRPNREDRIQGSADE